jgi:hypothetical protein
MPVRCSVTMIIRARLIVPALATATVAPAVTVASAATPTTPRPSGCVAPQLVGMTERAAARQARAAGCVVHLAGARLSQAAVQTIAAQAPAPGTRTDAVRLTLNPLCFGSALAGPPDDEGTRPGPTELITGLYIVGGPALPYSSPDCRRKPGKPAPGTIEVLDAAGSRLVATRTVKHGRMVTFRLAPGRYRVSGHAQPGVQIFARPFTIRAGYTTRQYVIEPVP